jgi:hypothetical protein
VTADDLYPAELRRRVERALERLHQKLAHDAPSLGVHLDRWLQSLAARAEASAYFTHPRAFPMLLLPWWLEGMIGHPPDRAFNGDVVYATITGYSFVRLIDDVMDGEHPPPSTVLPALIVLHTEFLRTYQRHFVYDHPFWDLLDASSMVAAESASRDAAHELIDRAEFVRTSARKIEGAKVTISAVCHHYGRPDLFEQWSAFVDALGRWHQMFNDVTGWHRDLGQGARTYFLSEADRRGVPVALVAEWVTAEGLAWGVSELEMWMADLLASASKLDCPPLVSYVEWRRDAFNREWAVVAPGLAALNGLASALR